jgi:hypothetical protein
MKFLADSTDRVNVAYARYLRRRQEREGEDHPPAQARLRAGQRLREPCRLYEQVIEAALAGEL